MISLLLMVILTSYVNGDILRKWDGMYYNQMTTNTSWDSSLLDADIISIESSEEQERVLPGIRRASCTCGCSNRRVASRIIGGDFYPANKYPFIAGVATAVSGGLQPFCGGSILTTNHILTAAHCTYNKIANQLAALLGTYDLTHPSKLAVAIPVRTIIQHTQYHPTTHINDIALLVLAKPMSYNDVILPVCLPSPGLDVTRKIVKILGWGAERPGGQGTMKPKEMDTAVYPTAQCSAIWQGIVPATKPTQMCTWSKDATPCKGDSGGPVVWLDPAKGQYTLVGVVSFGPNCSETKPAVHTKVVEYLGWIQQHISASTG